MKKIVLSLITLSYGLIPLLADLNASHVGNELWPPHARLHMVWLLASNSLLAGFALWLIWVKCEISHAITLGLIAVGGFWIATLTRDLYGGALADINGVDIQFFGWDANATVFFLLFGLLLVLKFFPTKRIS